MKDFKRYTLEPGVETSVFDGSGLYYIGESDTHSILIIVKYASCVIYGDTTTNYTYKIKAGKGTITYNGEGKSNITVRKLTRNY